MVFSKFLHEFVFNPLVVLEYVVVPGMVVLINNLSYQEGEDRKIAV
jgi:hypothetical protein